MTEVYVYPNGTDGAEYCMTDGGRQATLINLGSYHIALEQCNAIIDVYNKYATGKLKE